MTSDGRKGLVFSYNVCNLPREVTSNRQLDNGGSVGGEVQQHVSV